MIDTLMIFAAGRGTRMKHLTADTPKSLIQVRNKPILHYTLELAITYSFKKIVINSHYLHEQIHASIDNFKSTHQSRNLPEIITIYEPELLETGGAIKNAIKILGHQPIFTLNSDVIIKSSNNIFEHLASKWKPESMDFLLLLQPFREAVGYTGKGDFELMENNKLSRPENLDHYNYMYAGLSIVKPEVIALNSNKVFSLKEYYLNNDKVYGTIVRNCRWYHATTPEDIKVIESELEKDK